MYCDQHVYMSVCLSVCLHISKNTSILYEICCTCYMWHCSVLLWRLLYAIYFMYLLFVDVVIYSHNGHIQITSHNSNRVWLWRWIICNVVIIFATLPWDSDFAAVLLLVELCMEGAMYAIFDCLVFCVSRWSETVERCKLHYCRRPLLSVANIFLRSTRNRYRFEICAAVLSCWHQRYVGKFMYASVIFVRLVKYICLQNSLWVLLNPVHKMAKRMHWHGMWWVLNWIRYDMED